MLGLTRVLVYPRDYWYSEKCRAKRLFQMCMGHSQKTKETPRSFSVFIFLLPSCHTLKVYSFMVMVYSFLPCAEVEGTSSTLPWPSMFFHGCLTSLLPLKSTILLCHYETHVLLSILISKAPPTLALSHAILVLACWFT